MVYGQSEKAGDCVTDAELIECAKDFREGILEGSPSDSMCFAISAPLVKLLNFYGVESELVECENGLCNHFWIQLADGRALDPTADQFNRLFSDNLPPVYLGPPTKYQGVI
jgi:hypothetical protein